MDSIGSGRAASYAIGAIVVLALGGIWLEGNGSGHGATGARGAHAAGQPDGQDTGRTRADGGQQGHGQAREQTAVVVHVAGFIRRPGVYRFTPGSRVIDAVIAAGGPTSAGDQNAIDLAARLADGTQILIPRRGAPAQAPSPARSVRGGGGGSGQGSSAPVSLSQATADDLDRLDGIGPALAARIIAWRDSHGGFRSVDDLDDVPGIGPAKLASLRGALIP